MEFSFKTEPFPYQHKIWEETKDKQAWALFMEQGTGKTKVTLDTVAWQYHKKQVHNLLVLAPSGVHRNWVTDEIPKHVPEWIPWQAVSYQTSKAKNAKQRYALEELMGKKAGLSVLAMSYDAFMTKDGKAAAWEFMKKGQLMYVLDEATRIKNPKAQRTKAVMKSGEYTDRKRILTGTPVANGPFDIWAPVNFLSQAFWAKERFGSFYVFKHYFGDIVKKKANMGHEYEFVKGYKNLNVLHDLLSAISTRVTKKDVLKDLPPKLYSTRYFEMSPEQAKIYQKIEEEYAVQLGDDVLTMELAIVRMLRLQQVTCGYLPRPEAEINQEPYITLPGKNERLLALHDLIEEVSGQGIIWARFTHDIDMIMDMLNDPKLGLGGAVRYDGTQHEDERSRALEKFRKGEVRWFVSNTAVGGEGLTLTEATTVIYYNNTFKFSDRLQSEDRAHRIGQQHPVMYYDIAAVGTVDEDIIDSLMKKDEIANIITGDEIRPWIRS